MEGMAGMAAEEWPALKVQLLPCVQWLEFHHNTLAVWRAAKDEFSFPASQCVVGEMNCIVWRAELNCHYRSLEAAEAQALRGMVLNGWSFAELCLQLAETQGANAPLQAATWLKQWISDRVLMRKFE
ncbi:hypothetical protein D3C80_958080 [compost metagenome]